ncbi:MAG: hypothetical protein BWY74_01249 [Firmicutes bacterium ADurb.Bin419]|nr:MAG: hypothetical protein BWY74_01249 [Firmicutes bacterium ADurb.Bin419]
MPTFIKAGFWEKTDKAFKGWLNLDLTFLKSFNSSSPIADSGDITISSIKQTLTTSATAIDVDINYSGDSSIMELILNATSSVLTFPAGTLCVADGVASGDNTLTLSGVSGDKYLIGIINIGGNYSVVSRNFGQ